MRKKFERRPMAIDLDHMRMLHEEAIEQLELMQTALDAAEDASGTMRDTLENIVENHWHAYMDVLHMISLHDDAIAEALKQQGLKIREEGIADQERHWGARRPLMLLLITALARRHRRFWHIYGLRGNPMNDYVKESLSMERTHLAEITAMIDGMM